MKSDAKIKHDVQVELNNDPAVTRKNIAIGVQSGIVTLSGHVTSYREKMAVEKAVARVSGVKALVQELDVKTVDPLMVDDLKLAKDILDQFKWTTHIPDSMIKVKVEDGWVTLTGEVHKTAQRIAAEELVRSLDGVKGISNHLSLAEETIHPVDVKHEIEEALKREATREAEHISVKVDGRKVILEGEVHSFKEMISARDAALKAPGVTSVDNNLLVGD